MKSLFLKILLFFKTIWSFRKIRKFSQINKKLYKNIHDREVERIILKGKIVKMVREYVEINTSSKFIPPWYKTDAEIREQVLIKYGDEMKKLGIKIYTNLKLSA